MSTILQETARPQAPVATRPPRVLLACDWLLKYAAGLAQGLREAGAEVALLTRDHGLEYGGNAEEMREELRARLGADAPLWLVSGRIREVAGLRQLARIRSEIRAFGADLTHFQQATMIDPRLFIAAARRPRHYAVTLHDPSVHPGDQHPGRAFFALERLMFTGAGVTFTHGQALVDEIHERKPWLHGPIEIVPHGVDVLRPAPLPAVPSLLFFGRISHYKGLDVLLAAMPQVWESAPTTRLVIAGHGDIEPSAVLSDPRVTVHNEHVPESFVTDLYNDATAVVLPYRQASQSGVGSLAKSYGRASVVTNEGGLPELVADGSGIVVPSEDAGALANALIEVVTEPGRAEAMGAAASASAQAEFSWKAVGQATLDAYRRHGLALARQAALQHRVDLTADRGEIHGVGRQQALEPDAAHERHERDACGGRIGVGAHGAVGHPCGDGLGHAAAERLVALGEDRPEVRVGGDRLGPQDEEHLRVARPPRERIEVGVDEAEDAGQPVSVHRRRREAPLDLARQRVQERPPGAEVVVDDPAAVARPFTRRRDGHGADAALGHEVHRGLQEAGLRLRPALGLRAAPSCCLLHSKYTTPHALNHAALHAGLGRSLRGP